MHSARRLGSLRTRSFRRASLLLRFDSFRRHRSIRSARSTPPDHSTPITTSQLRTLFNKVPEITLYFWVIKILCTTVGETAADLLNENLGLGLTNTTYIMAARSDRRRSSSSSGRGSTCPAIYWLAVVLISVVGTLISDNLVDNLGVALQTTTIAFSVVLACVFAVWYASERTLSVHTIVTTRREAFYWLAILFTFALGTSAGDLLAEKLELGYLAVGRDLRRRDRGRRRRPLPLQAERDPRLLARLHPHPAARRLDRRLPLPAEGDGGLGLGTTATSVIFLVAILDSWRT